MMMAVKKKKLMWPHAFHQQDPLGHVATFNLLQPICNQATIFRIMSAMTILLPQAINWEEKKQNLMHLHMMIVWMLFKNT